MFEDQFYEVVYTGDLSAGVGVEVGDTVVWISKTSVDKSIGQLEASGALNSLAEAVQLGTMTAAEEEAARIQSGGAALCDPEALAGAASTTNEFANPFGDRETNRSALYNCTAQDDSYYDCNSADFGGTVTLDENLRLPISAIVLVNNRDYLFNGTLVREENDLADLAYDRDMIVPADLRIAGQYFLCHGKLDQSKGADTNSSHRTLDEYSWGFYPEKELLVISHPPPPPAPPPPSPPPPSPPPPSPPPPLPPPPLPPYCSTFTSKKKCKKEEACMWKNKECQASGCSTFATKKKCKKEEGCRWKDGECEASPLPDCSINDTKKQCKKVDGCKWSEKKGKCKPE